MILVQKPHPALSSPISMSFSHRRQSSAPVVVVQPTRIRGLLSLSKPPRSSPPRNQQRYNPKNAPKQAPSTSPTVPTTVVRAHAQPLTPTAQIYTAPATPPSQSRGRAQENRSKDKNLPNKRSPSRSSLRASGSGKHNGRQPSPPIPSTMSTSFKQKPSQAEVPVNSAKHFDSFSTPTPSPSPRKQPHQSQSKPIPVTTSLTYLTPTLARSDPLPIVRSNRQTRHQKHRPISKRALTIQEFPICDDMSEIADDDDEPSTPIARRLYEGAPLRSAPTPTIPLDFFSLPSPKKNGDWPRNRKHRRTPSEAGVFHMSSDEEVSSGPGGVVLNGNLNPNGKAFGPLESPADKTRENTTTPPRAVAGIRTGLVEGSTMNMSTSVDKATFFASSVFQNSPSPEELPDPLSL